ncbi:MAG: ymdC [Bacteroidota bacterium]|jgi:phosphatidylserine/phosphatidylglycerophosphate/cardiolipin synthase-like enzyme|nr:ymdC [Bacteroidota bacterium]
MKPEDSRAVRRLMRLPFLILLLSGLSSCRQKDLSSDHQKPADTHQNITTQNPDIDQSLSLSTENLRSKTGIYTLENGGKSLASRLWLFDNAEKTIDIQYYSFAKDKTGLIASDRIVLAADRGVKVRILIDDAASRMYSYEIQLLNTHENIDIRIYNAGLMLGRLDRRLKKLSENYNRLLRRMHNKTVTIDDKICITGGRNIADEYFDFDDRFNFRDRDVILFGKAVSDVKKSFELFWNDSLTVPYSKLSGKSKKAKRDEPKNFEDMHKKANESYSKEMKEYAKLFPKEITEAQKANQFIWVDQVSFVSDIPGKNEDRKERKGGICNDSIMSLIKQAKTFIDIQSPYFITTEVSEALIKETVDRGVKIRLLTNSLASIDNIEAFSGYQKDRETILKAGVDIFEFKPDSKVRFKLMIPEVQAPLNYKPVYGLHSKTIVIDGYITVIGSYNLDPRSDNYNTECFTIIRSREVAKILSGYLEEEILPENSWHVDQKFNPDAKAGIKKRIKSFTKKIIPKKLL